MLAKRVGELPVVGTWIFEPKWDGFRALVFRDGDEILIQSRDEKSLNRYFPDLLEPLKSQLPARCVLDGEIVIARDGALDFDALQLRIHPAESRVRLLASQMPASIVFFDLLCEGDRDLRETAFKERRRNLESVLATAVPPLHVTPATSDLSSALTMGIRAAVTASRPSPGQLLMAVHPAGHSGGEVNGFGVAGRGEHFLRA